MNQNYFCRTFSGPSGSHQGFSIGYYSIDYFMQFYGGGDDISFGSLNIRGGGGGGFFGNFPEIHQVISDIVQNKPPKLLSLEKLSKSPILIAHEHEQQDQEQTRVIFQNHRVNNSNVISMRLVRFVEKILEKDFSITLCNPHSALQEDLFNKRNVPLHNPIFMNRTDLEEFAYFLQGVARIQKKHYQSEVDKLLSILPSF